jgi:hypothetical protein
LKYTAILMGRRKFAWRPVINEVGDPSWGWVFKLEPVCGIRPRFDGSVVVHASALPFCSPSPLSTFTNLGNSMWSRYKLRMAAYAAVWILMVQIVTEFTGWIFGHPAIFGGLPVNDVVIYFPGQFLLWWNRVAPGYEWMITAAAILCGLLAVPVLVRAMMDHLKVREPANENSFFGTRQAARKAGLVRK